MRHAVLALFLLLGLHLQAFQAFGVTIPEIRRSLVRISAASQGPNYRLPWLPGNNSRGTGAGFVIEGNRILTNAHVVSNASFLSLERENDPKRYVAKVLHVAHDCDLAVLAVEDERFFEGTIALPFNRVIPRIESEVSVYGYPIGGKRLSVTTGVISRIDFQVYSHSAADSHLVIQTNAAINPGNSGGPVLQDGKVVGVAFQGYSGSVAQNVGYMIPMPVVSRFLKDIEDGQYDRYMDLSAAIFPLMNAAQRRSLGLPDDDRGVLVSKVMKRGASDGVLEQGDVILSIDGHTVSSDGFVELEGERVEMPEIVERKFKGDKVELEILRNRQPMKVTVEFKEAWPYQLQANQYEVQPRYVLFGGLLFQPLSRNFLSANQVDNLRVLWYYNYFVNDQIYVDRDEVILLSSILPDPINAYLGDVTNQIVDEVNGVKIRKLEDLAEAFAKPADDYVIKLQGQGKPVVLERKAIDEARERIRARYHVRSEQNLVERLPSL